MNNDQLPQSHSHPNLSLSEKGTIPLRVLLILVRALAYFTTRVFRLRSINERSIRRLGATAIGRNATSLLTVRQLQSIQPTTGQSIIKFCETEKLEHHVVRLEDTDGFSHASLHFIDCQPQNSDSILLYFHGGGFVFPIMNPAHLLVARSAAQKASAKLAVLEYGLAPQLQYPGQLAQSAAALRFLLQHHNGDASSIVIGGDSAGGNMTMGLLAHLSEPHPRVSPVSFAKGTKLRAVFCLSTRVKSNFDSPSFRTNASKDTLNSAFMNAMRENWRPNFDEVWTNPMQRDALFWKATKSQQTLLLVGGDEMYLDDNEEFASMMQVEHDQDATWKFFVCPGENHDQAVTDSALNIKDGIMLNELMKWMETV